MCVDLHCEQYSLNIPVNHGSRDRKHLIKKRLEFPELYNWKLGRTYFGFWRALIQFSEFRYFDQFESLCALNCFESYLSRRWFLNLKKWRLTQFHYYHDINLCISTNCWPIVAEMVGFRAGDNNPNLKLILDWVWQIVSGPGAMAPILTIVVHGQNNQNCTHLHLANAR